MADSPIEKLLKEGLPVQTALNMVMFHWLTHLVAVSQLGGRWSIFLVNGYSVTDRLGTGTSLRDATTDALKGLSEQELEAAWREVTAP